MRSHRSPSRPGLLRALHDRSVGLSTPSTFRSSLYAALVPSSSFINVSGVPSVSFRRFTPCGRFLVAMSRNQRDLVVYRFESGARRAFSAHGQAGLDFERPAFPPRAPPAPPPDPWLIPHHTPSSSARPDLSTPVLSDPTVNRYSPFATPHLTHAGPQGDPRHPFDTTISHLATNSTDPGSRGMPPHPLGLLFTLPVPLVGGVAPAAASPEPGIGMARNARRREVVSQKFSCHFSRFFTKMYQVSIALEAETLVPEFCLTTPKAKYLILSSYLPREADNNNVPQPPGGDEPIPAVAAVPVLERFTLHLVNVETGTVTDRFTLLNDFVELEGHAGVHMRGDMLCVLSIRHQILHVIKVQENLGRFAQENRIGAMCRPDDELELSRARDAEATFESRKREADQQRSLTSAAEHLRFSSVMAGLSHGSDVRRSVSDDEIADVDDENAGAGNDPAPAGQRARAEAPSTETGLGSGKLKSGFYTGLMQRLLVYVYRKYHRDRNQSMFYRLVGQYSLLVMLKAQFLDDDHLLIRLGSHERGGKTPDAATSTCFFVVYCISTTTILNLYENRSTELVAIYEKYRDIFIGDAAVSATLPPPRAELEDEVVIPTLYRAGIPVNPVRDRRATSKRTRTELSVLPVSCQTRNVSPYLDRQIFSYNVDRIAALDGTRALSLRDLNTVKFVSVRTGAMRFKLSPGLPHVNAGHRSRRDMDDRGEPSNLSVLSRKKKALFLFHPHYPFVMSMEYNLISPTTYNFHVHGFHE